MSKYVVRSPMLIETPTGQKGVYSVRMARRGDALPDFYTEQQIEYLLKSGTIEKVGEAVEVNFDPADHTVAEIVEYLNTVDGGEVARVIAAEIDTRGDKARKSVVNFAPSDKHE